MKRKITQFLMAFVAFTWAMPTSAALEYEITANTTPVQQKSFDYYDESTKAVAKSMAVANGIVYTVKFASAQIGYWNSITNETGNIDTGYSNNYIGWGIATDDNGNIIFQATSHYTNIAKKFCVYKSSGEYGKPVSASAKKEYTVPSDYNTSYAGLGSHFISASGDCYNGPGEIWIANATKTISCLNINASGTMTLTNCTISGVTWSTTTSEYLFNKYADGQALFSGRNQNIYDCTISGTTITAKSLLPLSGTAAYDNAPDIYYFQGHKIFVHNQSETNTDPYVVVKDLTSNGVTLATLATVPSGAGYAAATGSPGVGSYSRFEKGEDENTLYLYTFAPRCGFMKYKITATATNAYTDPVVSLEATINVDANGDQYAVLTWTAPAANATHVKNYKVYRGNTEIATVANNVLTYTDTEALIAETTYKVIPVYDNDVTVGTDVTVTIAPIILTAPVKNLMASCKYAPVGDGTYMQQAVLSWEAPASGASNVESYTIYRGDTQLATVGSDVLTYTDTEALTAEAIYKVVPNYEGGAVGDDATVSIAPTVYAAPTNLAVSQHAGYARVTITYTKCKDVAGLYVKYDILRDGAVIAHDLTQAEYVDTYVPSGEHSYTVEAEYYMPDAQGNYTVEVARVRCATTETINVAEMNHTLVNYTLVEEYNYEMWDIWNWDQANGKKLPANFNPNIKNGSSWIDAEHYRQGALVTDANGKKWWYIMQKTNSTTIDEQDGSLGGVLKISADGADLQIGGNAEMLSLPLAVKNGQSSGIAADEYGNFLIRGWYQAYDDAGAGTFNDAHNFAADLDNVIIYSADLSKSFVVDLSGLDFNTDPDGLNTNQWNSERVDYYRVSGDLMGTSYLYVVAGYGGSRTYTKVEMVNDGTEVEARIAEQYTPTTLDSGTTITIDEQDGAENYAFPIEETLAGSKGVIYQKRSAGYLYVPDGGGSNKDIFTSTGKIANTGGTTAKMANAKEASAAQLFLITPQSFHSRNIGSFSVAIVPNNNFENAVIPIANKVQESSENINADAEADNANANWLFAEWDAGDPEITGDENLYIYQYVPGVRIAKYRMYGSIGFYDTTPTLTINTTYDEDEGDITHFTATATWATPESYNGAGDYAIKYYKVELLDKNNNVIDEREVTATEGLYEFNRQDYTVTFNTTADLSNGSGVATGNEENHFIDDESLYTVRVTTVYDLRQVMQGTTVASSDLRNSATNTDQAQHIYNTQEPVPSVNIYKGTSGTVTGIYRIEFDLATPASTDERVSHYELYYTRKKLDWNTPDASTESGFAESLVTERIEDFILVSSSSLSQDITATEGQDVIPGVLVRNELHGQYMEDSKDDCYAAFFYDSKQDEWTEYNNDPTSWTYTIKAVYADDNTLLRKTTSAEVIPAPGVFIPTGVGDISNNVTELNAYPIPADTELTIQSGQNIEMVTILSTTGAEVKRVLGNGESQMTIDVEDIASGYYFLKVNNLPMVKIVVK